VKGKRAKEKEDKEENEEDDENTHQPVDIFFSPPPVLPII